MIVEFCIGFREMKASALEQICREAPESTIRNFMEENVGFKEIDRHIPVLYEVDEQF